MTLKTLQNSIATLTVVALCAAAMPAAAQDSKWPERPVKIVVPYAPGGSSDLLGRLAAQGLTEAFKQSFVIENRAGVGGIAASCQSRA